MTKITDPDYWRAVAIITCQPAYVTKHGFTPAARFVLASGAIVECWI